MCRYRSNTALQVEGRYYDGKKIKPFSNFTARRSVSVLYIWNIIIADLIILLGVANFAHKLTNTL